MFLSLNVKILEISWLKRFLQRSRSSLLLLKIAIFQDIFGKGNDHIVYLRDFGGDENFHLFSVNIHDGEEVDLTPFEGVSSNYR